MIKKDSNQNIGIQDPRFKIQSFIVSSATGRCLGYYDKQLQLTQNTFD